MKDLMDMAPRLEGGNLMVVDGLNFSFRWKHSSGVVDAQNYVDTIYSLAKSYEAGKVIVLTDFGGSSYRKAIYPEYKANRDYSNQTEEEKEAFQLFIESYNDAFELCDKHFNTLKVQGVEADDLAACIVDKYSEDFDHTWLISSDRDWDLLIGKKVSRFSFKTRKETTMDTWDMMYDVPMENYIDLKCLQGDSGDNVIGVAGVGPVRASKLLQEYGSVFDLVEYLPLPGRAKYIQNLNESKDRLLLNIELMDLRTYCWDALGSENAGEIEKAMA